jgi:serine/threonine protein kinase
MPTLDFGIAKLLTDGESAHESRRTQFAGRALAPHYASPEQIKGEPLTIASDIYSLGVVLYELLTGELPYQLKLQSLAQLDPARADAPGDRRVIHRASLDLRQSQLRFPARAARVRCSSRTSSSVNRVLTAITSSMGCAGSDGMRN